MILITGFKSYGKRAENPAATAAAALDGTTINNVAIRSELLPVRFDGLAEDVAGMLRRHQPELMLSLGLWPGEPCIRIEQFTTNLNDFEIPDNAGVLIRRKKIKPGGPDAYRSTLPTESIRRALLDKGIPARLSLSPGAYLCNALMYTALHCIHQGNLATRFGFVHLPYSPRQVATLIRSNNEGHLELHQRADLASMSPETVHVALTTLLQVSLLTAGED
jgi:pyroglutamyl-peptidase